jgi:hypothetical protein
MDEADVRRMLPPECQLIGYREVETPFKWDEWATVADRDKLVAAYMRDLGKRLESPAMMAVDSLKNILDRLRAAGVEIRVGTAG